MKKGTWIRAFCRGIYEVIFERAKGHFYQKDKSLKVNLSRKIVIDLFLINDFEEPMSENEKSPWITINGTNIADSQIAIEYLTKVTIIYELKTEQNLNT